ncbi:MAG TPA: 16S rRNA (guanine(966)-N(2))-methyltransferase RsmD [Blastocatellia bacterium]|nr:16S rRNA (guanine(966)-N(2))-methyltransferase RsmD [Blastocatellia bacterium]
MRVIAGKYKGRRLKTLDGLNVRPTSDRLRETLFNIIGNRVEDRRFLDLCAGSGAIGIEALSRGATEVTFVEQARRAHQVISDNLRSLGIDGGVHVVNRDAMTALKYFATHEIKFDVIYLDPPYDSELYSQVLHLIGNRDLLNDDGIIIAEHRRNNDLQERFGNLVRYRKLTQGDSCLSFYRAESDDSKDSDDTAESIT